MKKYNEAIQEIWYLSRMNAQLQEENNAIWKAYDDLIDHKSDTILYLMSILY